MIMKYTFAIGMILAMSSSAFAQSGGKTFITPLSGTAVLRDVEDKYNAQVISFEAPEPENAGADPEFRRLKAEVERRFPHRKALANSANAKTAAAPPQPIIVRGFVPDSNTSIPPDNYMAVNNGIDGINVMNSNVAILNIGSGAITARKTLFNFTSSVGLGTNATRANFPRYDPKVIYDPEADRFFFVTLVNINEDNYIVVGFSQSSDPGGGWNFYKFYGDYAADSTWFDYPTIAMTHDEVFLTGNKLVYNGSFQTGFRKSVVYEMRKREGYNGLPLVTRIWDSVNYGGAPIRNIFPVKGGGSVKGPGQYFLSVRNMASQNDSVFLLHIADTIGSGNNTLSIQAMKSNLSYGFPPNGRQVGIKDKLQTNDARVLGAFIEGSEIQFVSTTVETATGADAIYHGVMAGVGGTPTVQASYITVDTLDFAYPNISYAGTNAGAITSIISFDYSGPKKYPGLAAVFWDGTAHSALLDVKQGTNSINILSDSVERWGDYTGSQPKWNGVGHVWTVGIYGRSGNSYGVWMSLLRSPYAVGIGPDLQTGRQQASLYPNPTFRYIRLRFNLDEESALHFSIYNMAGALVDAVTDAKCEAGRNEIQFNTGTLPAGQYLLRGTDSKGRILVKQTFIKE